MPVLPDVRLDDHGLGAEPALALGGLDHGKPDAILHRAERIEELELGENLGAAAGVFRETAYAYERRGSNGVENAVVDTAAARGLGRTSCLFARVRVGKGGCHIT